MTSTWNALLTACWWAANCIYNVQMLQMPTRNFKRHGKESYFSRAFILNNRHPREQKGDKRDKKKFEWAMINAYIWAEFSFFLTCHCGGWCCLLLYRHLACSWHNQSMDCTSQTRLQPTDRVCIRLHCTGKPCLHTLTSHWHKQSGNDSRQFTSYIFAKWGNGLAILSHLP